MYHSKPKDNRDAIVKTLGILLLLIFISPVFAANTTSKTVLSNFMSPRDLLQQDVNSNISLHNNRRSPVNIFGLYVRQYAYVTPGQSCDKATIIYPSTLNTTAGAFVMPIMVRGGQGAAIGSNYLYNMIYQAIYYENIIIPVSPPGCALPGCTWGSDTTIYNWCIHLGALSPVATSAGYTSNVPPSTDAASTAGLYDYNLVTNHIDLGPISCNDQTQTCTDANQQSQSFS